MSCGLGKRPAGLSPLVISLLLSWAGILSSISRSTTPSAGTSIGGGVAAGKLGGVSSITGTGSDLLSEVVVAATGGLGGREAAGPEQM